MDLQRMSYTGTYEDAWKSHTQSSSNYDSSKLYFLAYQTNVTNTLKLHKPVQIYICMCAQRERRGGREEAAYNLNFFHNNHM